MQPFYHLTRMVNPKTAGVLVIVLAILALIPVGMRLNEQPQSSQSQAAPESARVSGTSLKLAAHKFNCEIGDPANGIKRGESCNDLKVGQIIAVDVLVNSDLDSSNLVKAQLNFDPLKLSVSKIVTTPAKYDEADFVIKNWISNNFKNDKGLVSLVGAVPDPGFVTTAGKPATVARVYFKILSPGSTTVSFDPLSSIYRSADNQNILNTTEDLKLELH